MKRFLFASAAFLFLFLVSCRKDSFITSSDAALTITADTLHFDTVFTSTGSATQVFKIKNDNKQKLRLDSITLGGGDHSFFRINADGFKGPRVGRIEIEGNDSIYVFATVSINPTAADLPFVVRDSIQVTYNGTSRFIQLEAYGQNAHFLRSMVITGNTTWPNDRPYVILGGLLVAPNAMLTIEKGCRIYLHADAPLVVDGTLNAIGEKFDSTRIYFRGDRTDLPYNTFPGSWPGIYFREASRNNRMEYVVVQHSYQGMVVLGPSSDANPKLTLNACILDNIYDAGILGMGTSITATNCLVSNAGGEKSSNIHLLYGGSYDFNHCTVVSYGNSYVTHNNPVLYLSNYTEENNTRVSAPLHASFRNCIFWGDNGLTPNEVEVTKDGSSLFNVAFNNCLLKISNDPADVTMSGVIKNESPVFDSININRRFFNFRLKASSPAIDKGIATPLLFDLDGHPRVTGALPDIGAYEEQ